VGVDSVIEKGVVCFLKAGISFLAAKSIPGCSGRFDKVLGKGIVNTRGIGSKICGKIRDLHLVCWKSTWM
jgi:hypothetical protein